MRSKEKQDRSYFNPEARWIKQHWKVKLIDSEKAKKICEIFTVDLSYVLTVKSTVEILQNFVAFSEYMNFNLHFFLEFNFVFIFLTNLISMRLGYVNSFEEMSISHAFLANIS